MAAIVVGYDCFESSTYIFHLGDFQEESRKLVNSRFDCVRQCQHLRFAAENIGKMVRRHRRARPGRNYDVFAIAEDIQKVTRDPPGILAVSAVESGLPTASLRLRKINLVAEPFQNFRRGQADGGEELVDDAGNEQRNFGSH
jgi:hypothetical protein